MSDATFNFLIALWTWFWYAWIAVIMIWIGIATGRDLYALWRYNHEESKFDWKR